MNIKKSTQRLSFLSFIILSLLAFGTVSGNANGLEGCEESTSSTDCEAAFSYQDYTGSLPVLGGFEFENLSSGDYTNLNWDFGDGTYATAGNATTHFYSQSGSYQVSLEVWDGNTQNCYSISTTTIEVSIPADPCDQLDCVWPGDTNADGLANLEDILNIGLDFGMAGPPRDSICGEWSGHLAEDWDEFTYDGVNLKHGDCNGDGIINLSDLPYTSNVSESYTRLENGVSNTNSDGPEIKLQFNVDTVFITSADDKPEISAAILFGNSTIPMADVYGVVLYLNFQGQYIDSSSQINIDYDANSFFGGSGEVIPRTVDLSDQDQVDFAIARTDGENVSGHGRIGTASFIIDADIIDGREEHEGQSFAVEVKVVKVIDKYGNDLDVHVSGEAASVFFVNNITTKIVDPVLAEKVKVFPNPVADVLNIDLGELNGEMLELYDILGKRLIHHELDADSTLELNVSPFEKGIYILKIQTDQGIVSKRVLVK